MRTLDLAEAAAFLGLHPHTLQARAKAGTVPGNLAQRDNEDVRQLPASFGVMI